MKKEFNADYIGKDQNASGVPEELPIGFGMSLAQHTDAMNFFGTLDTAQKSKIISYIQNAQTGDEARQRIDTAVNMMQQHDVDFMPE